MQVRTEPATLEQIYELGRQAAQHIDTGRWTIGDLALLVEKNYGQDRIADFARESNVPKKRVQEYRTVCGFYEKSARADFLEANPMITYTHFRTAMRRSEVDKAYEFLDRCSLRGWTCDKADYVMMRLLGRKSSTAVKILPPTPFRVIGADRINRRAMLQFEDDMTAERFASLYRDNERGLELSVTQKPPEDRDNDYNAPLSLTAMALDRGQG